MEKQQLWAQVQIVVHPNKKEKDENGTCKTNHYNWHTIRRYNYPKWIIDKHRWFFQWVQALVQCRFPKHHVSYNYCGYYPETKEKLMSKRQQAISSAKAQITKYENKIEQVKQYCSGTLFSDYTKHPVYPKLKSKLEENKFKLEQAVMAAVNETI